jgi:acetate kinase
MKVMLEAAIVATSAYRRREDLSDIGAKAYVTEIAMTGALLVVNTGSSSVKLAAYQNASALDQLFRVTTDATPDHRTALLRALDSSLAEHPLVVDAVGHRVVHGGAVHAQPERLTPSLLHELRELTTIDPDHMPQALETIDEVTRRFPHVPQIACFDTAFHRTMPEVARRYPLPPWTADAGVRRYGFHGLSCEYVVSALERTAPQAVTGRLLIAHLGNGASITAVRDGASVDTTMGFSPTGGLMMGTRSGDLDPTVLTFLAASGHRDVGRLRRLVNAESGLRGVSGLSGDVRELLAQPAGSPASAALELFCYTARKQMGALAAVLDGVDTIVFIGGIGEHAPPIRDWICSGLQYLGVQLDPRANASNAGLVSSAGSRVAVRVIATDEERVIARHVRRLIAESGNRNP